MGVLAPASAIAAVAPHPPVPLAALQSFVAVYERIRQRHVDAKTDEELHDALGLSDRGIYHILTAIKRNNRSWYNYNNGYK